MQRYACLTIQGGEQHEANLVVASITGLHLYSLQL